MALGEFSRKALKNDVDNDPQRDGPVGYDGQKAERDEEKHSHDRSMDEPLPRLG